MSACMSAFGCCWRQPHAVGIWNSVLADRIRSFVVSSGWHFDFTGLPGNERAFVEFASSLYRQFLQASCRVPVGSTTELDALYGYNSIGRGRVGRFGGQVVFLASVIAPPRWEFFYLSRVCLLVVVSALGFQEYTRDVHQLAHFGFVLLTSTPPSLHYFISSTRLNSPPGISSASLAERKYGLRVNLDLPGSQNGYSHSGKLGQINFLSGPRCFADAQRMLHFIRGISEFLTQPQYANLRLSLFRT
ncbi:hypothetical protein C8R45DRAFT_971063 [Mycena sanguinolenta]|nr:hypothetical protein C8R45DRAFT_971063 [Mycena sanguinolenta]